MDPPLTNFGRVGSLRCSEVLPSIRSRYNFIFASRSKTIAPSGDHLINISLRKKVVDEGSAKGGTGVYTGVLGPADPQHLLGLPSGASQME